MDRDIDIEQHEVVRGRPAFDDAEAAVSREPEPYSLGAYRYFLSEAQLRTMAEVGRFRTVNGADLERFQYHGNAEHCRKDIAALTAQGIAQTKSVYSGPDRTELTVIVLTKRGKALLESTPLGKQNSDQAFYSGLVKPAEIRHDAAIYPMFQAEKARIEQAGGRVRRIILDYELKRSVYKPLAKAKPTLSPSDFRAEQDRVARQNNLKIVRGKILLPDLRIEYEDASGVAGSVDLELATAHYRSGMMRAKAEAGFKFYASRQSAGGLAAAFDPEIVANIFLF